MAHSPLRGFIFPSALILALAGFLLLGEETFSSSGIEIDASVGFREIFKLGKASPLSVTLENRGTSIKGQIKIDVAEGSEYRGDLYFTTYVRHVDLPAKSKKRLLFTLPLRSFTRPLIIRLEYDGREIARKEIDLRDYFTTDNLILILSREIALDFLSTISESKIRVVHPYIEQLPDNPRGYEGIEAVVIHNLPLGGLSLDQLEALKKWVAMGGTIVFSGGVGYTQYGSPRLKGLLPVEIDGFVELGSLSSLATRYGHKIEPSRGFVISKIRSSSGHVYLAQGEHPLIVSKEIGRGKVIFLAFDFARHPIANWEGKFAMWRDLLGLSRKDETFFPISERKALENELIYPLLRLPVLRFPSHLELAVFLILYLASAGFLLRWVARKATRTNVVWVFFIASSFLFTTLGYFLFNRWLFKEDALFVQVATVRALPGTLYAEVDTDLGVFSTRSRRRNIRVEGQLAEVSQLVPTARKSGLYDYRIIEGDGGYTIQDIHLERWSMRLFKMKTILEFPLDGKMVLEDPNVKALLRNDTDFDIHDSWMIYKGRPYRVGDLKAGKIFSETFFHPQTTFRLDEPWSDFWREMFGADKNSPQMSLEDRMRQIVLEGVLKREDRENLYSDSRLTFVGWLSDPPVAVAPEKGPIQHRKLSLVSLTLSSEGQ